MKKIILKAIYYFLAYCTRIYLWRTKPLVIWVTGSVGKTSCRTIIAQVLQQIQKEKVVYSSPKNFNSELGLIFSIFGIEKYEPSVKNITILSLKILKNSLFWKKKYNILIAEYGIDAPGDMDFLLHVMKPHIWIITKLDSVHSDNFPGGVEQLWQDKFKLLLASKNGTYFNFWDNFSKQHENFLTNNSYIFHKNMKNVKLSHEGNQLQQSFVYEKKSISINLIWDESVEYTKLSLDIAQKIGIKLWEKNYDFKFIEQEWRFSLFERNGNILIDSSYNAGPESMKQVILNTQKFRREVYPNYKLIYVLWDMREIGDVKKQAHMNLWELLTDAYGVYTIWPEMYQYLIPKLREDNFPGMIHSSLSAREIWKKLKKYLSDHWGENFIVLFKWSQNTIFTEEALALQLTPTQRKSIPRQTKDWNKKKDVFFEELI